jgi:hypothetical protein
MTLFHFTQNPLSQVAEYKLEVVSLLYHGRVYAFIILASNVFSKS